jgi:hypothetical protein
MNIILFLKIRKLRGREGLNTDIPLLDTLGTQHAIGEHAGNGFLNVKIRALFSRSGSIKLIMISD